MLRYKTEIRPGLVAMNDIRPGNGAVQFLQPPEPARGHDVESCVAGQQNRTVTDVIEMVFCKLCNLIVDTGEWPDDWRRSVFVTIPKVKWVVRCEDYRTIALISHASKILLKISIWPHQ